MPKWPTIQRFPTSSAGIDASDYDWQRGPMDLNAAARDGILFFTHKATEATSTRHSHYGEAMRRARDAGIPVLGAYHVVRTSPSPSAQVDYYLSYLDSQTPWWRSWPDWFFQVDLEKWSYDSVRAGIGEAFADIVQERTGRKAIIYASRGQYGNELTGTSHELWNANYGSNPIGHYRSVYSERGGDTGPGWAGYSGRIPVFWQFGARTRIGSQPTCDANAFRGTLAQLRALISGSEIDMFEQPDRDVAGADTARLSALINGLPAAQWKASWSGEQVHVEPNTIKAQLDRIEAKPGVEPAPVDAAALKAVLLDPEVLAAIAQAVLDAQSERLAE